MREKFNKCSVSRTELQPLSQLPAADFLGLLSPQPRRDLLLELWRAEASRSCPTFPGLSGGCTSAPLIGRPCDKSQLACVRGRGMGSRCISMGAGPSHCGCWDRGLQVPGCRATTHLSHKPTPTHKDTTRKLELVLFGRRYIA